MSVEGKEEQLEFARKLLDTSKGFYIQVGKPTFIMLIDIIAEQQKEIKELNQVIKSKNKEIKLMKNTDLAEEHDKALKVIDKMADSMYNRPAYINLPYMKTKEEIKEYFYKEIEVIF